MTLQWKGPREPELIGPMGAYLYFVLYVVPYPQHHDPEHRLRQTETETESRLHTRGEMEGRAVRDGLMLVE